MIWLLLGAILLFGRRRPRRVHYRPSTDEILIQRLLIVAIVAIALFGAVVSL